jgi:hypothetical protein
MISYLPLNWGHASEEEFAQCATSRRYIGDC